MCDPVPQFTQSETVSVINRSKGREETRVRAGELFLLFFLSLISLLSKRVARGKMSWVFYPLCVSLLPQILPSLDLCLTVCARGDVILSSSLFLSHCLSIFVSASAILIRRLVLIDSRCSRWCRLSRVKQEHTSTVHRSEVEWSALKGRADTFSLSLSLWWLTGASVQ